MSLTTRAAAQTLTVGPLIDIESAADNTVAENSPAGSAVGITAQAAGATTYTLIDSVGGLFAIDPQSGTVTVAMNMLNYEAFSSHSITVRASDEVSGSTASFFIQVTDEPEPVSPIADIDFNANKIAYGAMPGAPVGITARASDQDRGSTVSYSLTENPMSLFAIDPQDGVVTLASDDYDPDQDYRIEILAMSYDKTSSSAQFTVRRDEPIRIVYAPMTSILREGKSQGITFSFTRTDLELKAISAGAQHSCGITPDNRAVCWGNDSFGSIRPPANTKFIAVSADGLHSCGITSGNDAVCWGSNQNNRATPPSGKKFIAVSAGSFYSCGITTGNDAVCWGLGSRPRAATNLFQDKKFIAISVGGRHSCGITAAKDVVCWGGDKNIKRELVEQSAPPSGRKFSAISAGSSHSCAITADNDAVCWGDNSSGQTMPTPDKKLLAISAGAAHSCAITTASDAVCWGDNSDDRATPPSGKKFIAISAGELHTCAITADNDAVCWGSNDNKRSMPPQITPAAADSMTITAAVLEADREQISVSDNAQAVIPAGATQASLTVSVADDNIREPETAYAIALSATGHAELEQDELIITVPVDELDPVEDVDSKDNEVAENSPIGAPVGITLRSSNATAYTLIDSVDGLFAIHPQSGAVTVAADMLDHEAFSSYTITAQISGAVSSQTRAFVIKIINAPEPLGAVADIDLSPNKISRGATRGDTVGITARAVDPDRGSTVSYSLSEDAGGLFRIGEQDGIVSLTSDDYKSAQNYLIEVTATSSDDPSTSSSAQFIVRQNKPIRIALAPAQSTLREGESRDISFFFAKTGLEVKGISAGEFHSCGITPDNGAVCWGHDKDNRATPPSGEKFIAVSAGFFHSCGITPDNGAVCWGHDEDNRATPPLGEKFIAISAGELHTCAITSDNDAVCWGSNSNGQTMPTPDQKLIAISAGNHHSCAITSNNNAICWGSDNYEQSAPPIGRKFMTISAGNRHTCAVTVGNDAVCWGSNDDKQSAPPSGRKFIAISAGFRHSCGITATSDAICWGVDVHGRATPPSGKKFIAISAGGSHSCGIATDNTALCWGFDESERAPSPQITPTAADSITITATVSDADWEQIRISDNGQNVIPAGKTQVSLIVSATDDNIREPETSYAIAIRATGYTELEQDELIITVPADGDTEVMRSSDKGEVAENSPAGSTVGITIQAANAASITLSDNAGGRFTVSGAGLIVVANGKLLNFEDSSSHSITAQVSFSDGSDPVTQAFVIAVTDVNEFELTPTADSDQDTPNELAENAAEGSRAGITLSAADADGSAMVTYTLTDSDNEIFLADTNTGMVTLRGQLNYERSARHTIIAQAMSSDGSDPTTEAFVIAVTDVNEFGLTPTADSDQGTPNELAENAAEGSRAGITLSAADADGSAMVTYTLTDSDNGLFLADTNTGIVTLRGQLNYERSTQHTIIAQAMSDDGSDPTTEAFTIVVINVNEITLRDGEGENNLARASTGFVVTGMALKAVHSDAAPITTWELRQDAGLFELTQTAGSSTQGLRIKADAENLSSYIGATVSLSVTVRTEHDEATETFTIGFTEQEPVLVGELRDIDDTADAVAESSPAGSTVGITIQADNATTYTLIDGANGRFAISSETGLVTVANGGLLDFEDATTHSITVEARSINDRRSMRFAIRVTDVNEFELTQVIDSDPTADELSENAVASSRAGITLSATDADGSAVVTYMLTDSNDGLFLADTNTGMVTLRGQLNYERSTRHTIIAQAMSDDGSDPTTEAFTIAVINVNEITLEDTDPTRDTVTASASATVEGLTLRATHADNAAIASWEITTQTDGSNPVDLFELSEPQDSAIQTLRIMADADLALITAPTTVTLSVSVHTAYDEASEDFNILVSPPPAEGIRLRIRVYLEGALE